MDRLDLDALFLNHADTGGLEALHAIQLGVDIHIDVGTFRKVETEFI